jgi:hypothetical protein
MRGLGACRGEWHVHAAVHTLGTLQAMAKPTQHVYPKNPRTLLLSAVSGQPESRTIAERVGSVARRSRRSHRTVPPLLTEHEAR